MSRALYFTATCASCSGSGQVRPGYAPETRIRCYECKGSGKVKVRKPTAVAERDRIDRSIYSR